MRMNQKFELELVKSESIANRLLTFFLNNKSKHLKDQRDKIHEHNLGARLRKRFIKTH